MCGSKAVDKVLKSEWTLLVYLNPGLWQVNLERHLLPHEDVGVASLLEQGLQHVQLRAGKGRPFSSLFPVKRGENSDSVKSGTGFQHVKLRPRMDSVQRENIQLWNMQDSSMFSCALEWLPYRGKIFSLWIGLQNFSAAHG
jgi:hypothetical protein